MNVIHKVTWQSMKKSRRRTLVTIIGVIISVAMMTAVATAGYSFMDLWQRHTMASTGRWHVLYRDVAVDKVDILKNDSNTGEVILSGDIGYSKLEGCKNSFKPYLFFKAYSGSGMENMPIRLLDGRLPQNADEIAIPKHLETNGGIRYEIGDEITVKMGSRVVKDDSGEAYTLGQNSSLIEDGSESEAFVPDGTSKTYKIVGVISRPDFENYWAPGYTVITWLPEDLAGFETINVSLWEKHVSRSIYNDCMQLGEMAGVDREKIVMNDALLSASGISNYTGYNQMILSLIIILVLIIMVSSISLIYNAFAISLSERSKQLGMLSSAGATKKQKRSSVFYEGFVVGIISIPAGLLSGIGGIAVTFKLLSPKIQQSLGLDEPLRAVVKWEAIVIAVVFSILTIFISAYIPAKRASKISPIDSIRQSKDVRLTKKAVKTSKLTRKIFGFEAELALKNLKRNKKRYRATLISLTVSLVLFLSVSGFVHFIRQDFGMAYRNVNYDFAVTGSDAQLEACRSLDGVSDSAVATAADASGMIYLKEFKMTAAMEQAVRKNLEDWEYKEEDIEDYIRKLTCGISLRTMNDEAMEKYAAQLGLTMADLDSSGGIYKGIIINSALARAKKQAAQFSQLEIEPGDKLSPEWLISQYNDENGYEEKITNYFTLEAAAVTDIVPLGVDDFITGSAPAITIIMKASEFTQLLEKVEDEENINLRTKTLYLKSSEPEKTMEALDKYQAGESMDTISYSSSYKNRRDNENMLMVVSVFSYGFIALMTAICTANILNTTSTSISLRRREFAMLKSVGMTPAVFNKMILFESLFYGIKSILFGLPAGLIIIWVIFKVTNSSFRVPFTLPWINIGIAVLMIFMITGISMRYATGKIKKENVIDALKDE